jgi:hypothetical protein
VPVNFMLGPDEVAYILDHSGAVALVAEAALVPTATGGPTSRAGSPTRAHRPTSRSATTTRCASCTPRAPSRGPRGHCSAAAR